MVWLKRLWAKIKGFFEDWKERRKFKKRIKELQKKDPFIYKQDKDMSQDRTEEAFRIIEQKVTEMLTDKDALYDPLEIAGVMCAQAIKIYKTALNKQDYDDIMEAIFLSRDEVTHIKGPTKH